MTVATATGATVEIRNLGHAYGKGKTGLTVLRDISVDIVAGDYIALTGRSGAGKSTMLSILGGIERPQQGTVSVAGHDIGAMTRRELAAYRRRTVGFVFQTFGLVDVLTAAENVALAMALARVPPATAQRRAVELLEAVGLQGRAGHRPAALSGGERQRVAIARALVASPALLLADEPTGNLDDHAADEVMHLLERLRSEHGCTLVIVTHNASVAARASCHLRLDDGVLVTR